MSVTKISTCTTTSCAFNNGGCTAFAITVGGDNGAPACDTFISLDARGGLPVAEGHVGACQRLECVHNKDLMCTAEAVTVGGRAPPPARPTRFADRKALQLERLGANGGCHRHGGIPRFGFCGQLVAAAAELTASGPSQALRQSVRGQLLQGRPTSQASASACPKETTSVVTSSPVIDMRVTP